MSKQFIFKCSLIFFCAILVYFLFGVVRSYAGICGFLNLSYCGFVQNLDSCSNGLDNSACDEMSCALYGSPGTDSTNICPPTFVCCQPNPPGGGSQPSPLTCQTVFNGSCHTGPPPNGWGYVYDDSCDPTMWDGCIAACPLAGSCSAGTSGNANWIPNGHCNWLYCSPYCTTGGPVNCGACNIGSHPTNTCGTTTGSQTCQHNGNPGGSCIINGNSNYTNSCTASWNNCQNPFSCQGGNTCKKTMGGRVTDSTTGNGIAGVVIAGGTTNPSGYWTVNNTTNNMSYGSSFTFTAPSGAGGAPCNAGFECGAASPNPGSYSGTVGGGGDCGMNCNFTYTPGSISGHIWIDNDHDGVSQIAGEPNGFAGIIVTTDDPNKYTTTDNNGNYTLNYLSTRNYTVDVPDFIGYHTITSPQTLAIPPNRTNINFAIANAYDVSGHVFTDYNYNNVYDTEDSSYNPSPAINILAKDTSGNTLQTIPVLAETDTGGVNNPSFEVGLSPWVVSNGGTLAQYSNATDGSYSGLATVATAGNSWSTQLQQPNVPVVAGDAYDISFDARKAGGDNTTKTVSVWLQQTNGPDEVYGASPTWTLTSSWQTFKFTFVSPITDAGTSIRFNIGTQTGNYLFDNIHMNFRSYAAHFLYNGNYTLALSPMPPAFAQSPPVPNPVTVNNADIPTKDLGISPLYDVSGNVYQDLNRDACWEPAYDPLYKTAGTSVTFTNSQYGDVITTNVVNGNYDTNKTLHAGTWTGTYTVPATYSLTWPPVQYIITVGTPGKSIACDTTLAQNPVCW